MEGYKSGKVNAIHYGKQGYNIGGDIGGYLGPRPIVGFGVEHAVLPSIPAPIDGTFSLMTPSVKSMIEPTLTTGINAGLGTKSLKISQGTKVGDVRMMRGGFYVYVGKGCGHVIGGVLGAAGGLVIGGIAGGAAAIPEGVRKGLAKACKDPFVTQHPNHSK